MASNILVVFFFFFLTDVASLPPAQAGVILSLGTLANAMITLIVGVLSDRTPKAWGRRRVWMFWSAPIMGISFILHWWIPPLSGGELMSYYLVVVLAFQVASSSFLIPYCALLTDLTQDSQEHLQLNNWRFIFTLLGAVGSILLMQGMTVWIPDPMIQLQLVGLIGGIVTIASIHWCCVQTCERTEVQSINRSFQWQDLVSLGCNRALLLLLGIFSLSWTALQITPTLLPYFVTQTLNLDPSWVITLILLIKVSTLAALFVWEPLSQRYSKLLVFSIGVCIWLAANGGLLFLNSEHPIWLYGLSSVAGVGMASVYLIPPALLPDVIHRDEQVSGQRRDGLFNSMMLFSTKVVLACGLFLFGQILAWCGFQEGSLAMDQPELALSTIRQLVVDLPSVCLVTSLILIGFYPKRKAPQQEPSSPVQHI